MSAFMLLNRSCPVDSISVKISSVNVCRSSSFMVSSQVPISFFVTLLMSDSGAFTNRFRSTFHVKASCCLIPMAVLFTTV